MICSNGTQRNCLAQNQLAGSSSYVKAMKALQLRLRQLQSDQAGTEDRFKEMNHRLDLSETMRAEQSKESQQRMARLIKQQRLSKQRIAKQNAQLQQMQLSVLNLQSRLQSMSIQNKEYQQALQKTREAFVNVEDTLRKSLQNQSAVKEQLQQEIKYRSDCQKLIDQLRLTIQSLKANPLPQEKNIKVQQQPLNRLMSSLFVMQKSSETPFKALQSPSPARVESGKQILLQKIIREILKLEKQVILLNKQRQVFERAGGQSNLTLVKDISCQLEEKQGQLQLLRRKESQVSQLI